MSSVVLLYSFFRKPTHKHTLKQNDASKMAREESPVCYIICLGK